MEDASASGKSLMTCNGGFADVARGRRARTERCYEKARRRASNARALRARSPLHEDPARDDGEVSARILLGLAGHGHGLQVVEAVEAEHGARVELGAVLELDQRGEL